MQTTVYRPLCPCAAGAFGSSRCVFLDLAAPRPVTYLHAVAQAKKQQHAQLCAKLREYGWVHANPSLATLMTAVQNGCPGQVS